LFSDILTPLPGMNIPFDIVKGKGPVIYDPLRTAAAVNEVREFVPEEWVPYVGQALNILRQEVSKCGLLVITKTCSCGTKFVPVKILVANSQFSFSN
jgi:uroporphyrinogen-III decarboxylase